MSEFSRTLIDRSGYEREGFAEVYDRYRPSPPEALLDILTLVAQAEQPRLVVDLGAGTGLSTRAWAARAVEVVGVEANARMVEQARRATPVPNVRYVEAFAAETHLPEGIADLVTCSQAFHWMEPVAVLAEAARVLRAGGLFAAYDYDVPPVVHPAVDAAFARHLESRAAARTRLGIEAGASTWPKESHLARIRASGHFRLVRELVCHGFYETDAERLVGLAESIGGPRALFGGRTSPEVEETFAELAHVAGEVLVGGPWRMVVCYRMRVGVK